MSKCGALITERITERLDFPPKWIKLGNWTEAHNVNSMASILVCSRHPFIEMHLFALSGSDAREQRSIAKPLSTWTFLWIWLVHKMPGGHAISVDFCEPVVTSLFASSWQRSDITWVGWLKSSSGNVSFNNGLGSSSHTAAQWYSRLLISALYLVFDYANQLRGFKKWLHIMQHCIRPPSKSHSLDNSEKMGF